MIRNAPSATAIAISAERTIAERSGASSRASPVAVATGTAASRALYFVPNASPTARPPRIRSRRRPCTAMPAAAKIASATSAIAGTSFTAWWL